MKTTTRTLICHEIDLEVDGLTVTIPVDFLPDEYEDEVHVSVELDGSLCVRYLVRDEHHDLLDYLLGYETDVDGPGEQTFFGDYRNHHTPGGGEERRDEDAAVLAERLGADHVFVVDVYNHGGEHYSLAGSGTYYQHRKWDCAPACLVAVPADVTDPKAYAQGFLDELNAVLGGDVWGCVELVVTKAGEVLESDSVWGFIGDHAREVRTSGY